MAKKRDIYKDTKGFRLPSVTGITGTLSKPQLIPWAAKMAVEHVRVQWEPGKIYERERIDIVLEDAKNAHRVTRDNAGLEGTDVHELVGAYIEKQITIDDLTIDRDKRILEGFMIVTKDWRWVGSEIVLLNEELGYGGTADAGAYDPQGQPILPDIKTSKGDYPEFSLQLAMYALAHPIDPNLHSYWEAVRKFGEGRILHFNKERLTWEVLEKDLKSHYEYIPHICKMHEWQKKYSPSW